MVALGSLSVTQKKGHIYEQMTRGISFIVDTFGSSICLYRLDCHPCDTKHWCTRYVLLGIVGIDRFY